MSGSSHSSKNTRGRRGNRAARSRIVVQPALEIVGERLRGALPSNQRADGPDHAQDLVDAALIERHNGIAATNELCRDVRLQIGECQNEVRLQRVDFVEPRVDERRDLRLAAAPPAAAPCSRRCRPPDRLRQGDTASRWSPRSNRQFDSDRRPSSICQRSDAELKLRATGVSARTTNREPRIADCESYTCCMRFLILIVALLTVSASEAGAQRRGAGRKPVPAAPPKIEPVQFRCPEPLGLGVKTGAAYCFVLAGRDPEQGVRIPVPAHTGIASLIFDLHNRHTYSDEDIRAGRGFAKYTAVVAVLTMKSDLLGRGAVQIRVSIGGGSIRAHLGRRRARRGQGRCAARQRRSQSRDSGRGERGQHSRGSARRHDDRRSRNRDAGAHGRRHQQRPRRIPSGARETGAQALTLNRQSQSTTSMSDPRHR